MGNPFETIDNRLANIECLLIDLKKERTPVEAPIDKILGVEEAAKFLHLKVPSIYGLISKRQIPSFKRGKRVYFKTSELTQWLEGGKRKTVDDLATEARNFTNKK